MTAALARAVAVVDGALLARMPDERERRTAVATLWASMQGIASLHAAKRLAALGGPDPRAMARMLVRRFASTGVAPQPRPEEIT